MTPKRFTLACSGNATGFSMTKFQYMGDFVLIPALPISAKFDVLEQTLTTCFADGTLLHQAKSTMEFLQHTVPNFIEPSECPPTPNSPDLNPVDHGVWGGALQQSVYRIPISNSDDLNDRVRTCRENLDQRNEQIIDKFRAVLTNGRSGHVPRAPGFFSFRGAPNWL